MALVVQCHSKLLAFLINALVVSLPIAFAFSPHELLQARPPIASGATTSDNKASEDINQQYDRLLLDTEKCNQNVPSSTVSDMIVTRRTLIGAAMIGTSMVGTTLVNPSEAKSSSTLISGVEEEPFSILLNDEVISSLIYKKVLGRGSYKTVYLVQQQDSSGSSLSSSSSSSTPKKQWALAVEKVRSKAEAKNRLKGIRRAEEIQTILAKKKKNEEEDRRNSFERVERWWFQSTPLPEFEADVLIFPSTTTKGERTQAIPHKFLGRSKWLVALKPLYDMDLKKFASKAPTRYPIGSSSPSSSSNGASSPATTNGNSMKPSGLRIVAGIDLNHRDISALRLAYEICQAGRIMHDDCSLIHRDIKPANIMLRDGGRPVIIDFGFSDFRDNTNNKQRRLCIEEPGKIKGEVGYMLSSDAALYRGCLEGDTYAMGKTLYEVVFGAVATETASSSSSDSSSSESYSSSSGSSSSSTTKMTVEKIRARETKFRKLLSSSQAGTQSRFLLSENGRDILMCVIQGLCRNEDPISFREAAEFLKKNEIQNPV